MDDLVWTCTYRAGLADYWSGVLFTAGSLTLVALVVVCAYAAWCVWR